MRGRFCINLGEMKIWVSNLFLKRQKEKEKKFPFPPKKKKNINKNLNLFETLQCEIYSIHLNATIQKPKTLNVILYYITYVTF